MKRFIIWIILFLLVYFVVDGKVIPLQEILKPETIEIFQNRIYISEGPQVRVYSLKDLSPIATFGREGEGPNEFKTYPTLGVRLSFLRDELLVTSVGKLSYFDLDGRYRKETATTFISTGGVIPIERDGICYISDGRYREGQIAYNTINLYDHRFTKIKEVAKYVKNEQRGKKIDPMNPGFPKYQVYGDRIYSEEADRVINAFSFDGSQIATIAPEDEKLPITAEYKEEFFAFLKKRDPEDFDRLKKRFVFPEHYPVIHGFKAADNRLYIVTWKKKEGKSEIKIHTLDGKYIKTAYCAGLKANPMYLAPYTIHKGRVYHLQDNPDTETWELIVTPLD